MSSKSIEIEAKRPDAFMAASRTALGWMEKNTMLIAACAAIFVVAGAGYSLWSYWTDHQETQLQEALFPIEKSYLSQKEKFEKAKAPPPPPSADSKEPKPDPGVKATGDLQKDYGQTVADLETFVKAHPQSVAGRMAALDLSEIYQDYKQPEKSLEVLTWVTPASVKDLTSALVLYRTASLQGDKKDCESAQKNLDKIIAKGEFAFLAPEARIQKGLCYELQNDFKAAEEQYSKAAEGNQNSASARTAEKYLRLVQSKKNQNPGS